MVKKMETDEFHFSLLENGLLLGGFKNETIMDLELAIKVVEARAEFTNKEHVSTVIDVSGAKKFSKEAREYLSSEDGFSYLLAAAIVTTNPLSNLLMNFFINVHLTKVPVPVPVKLFTDKDKATEWAIQYIKN